MRIVSFFRLNNLYRGKKKITKFPSIFDFDVRVQKWSAPSVLEPNKNEKRGSFNWSYNLNKDMFWSKSNNTSKETKETGTKNKSVPSTPTVALPATLYKQKRGLGNIGKKGSGRF